jgi:formate hydrogenlyase subunit 3/multisubunit Na+/H+ antiporter MnhD subunit
MKNRELEPLGGFDRSFEFPTWVGVAFFIGALLLASIPVKG